MPNTPKYDASGYEVLTKAVSELLNQYPGLDGRIVSFEELGDTEGIAFSADNGGLVLSEKRYITDHIEEKCQYPFFVVYRTAATRAAQKINVVSFLETFGKWICKETVTIGGTQYRLNAYPELSDGRKITKVTRNNAYGTEPQQNGVQDWLLPVSVEYTHEYDEGEL